MTDLFSYIYGWYEEGDRWKWLLRQTYWAQFWRLNYRWKMLKRVVLKSLKKEE